MGTIVAGGAVPGGGACRQSLLPIARVPRWMSGGGLMLSAMWALHRCQPNAGHAKEAEEQHQNTSHHRSHRVSIAAPFLPRNHDSPGEQAAAARGGACRTEPAIIGPWFRSTVLPGPPYVSPSPWGLPWLGPAWRIVGSTSILTAMVTTVVAERSPTSLVPSPTTPTTLI